ncbi:MAG: hypothetical protein ACI8SA_000269, partial [Dokdonia sp.]
YILRTQRSLKLVEVPEGFIEAYWRK